MADLPARIPVACPRCAQSADERRKDHRSKHAVGCEFARGRARKPISDAPVPVSLGRESAKRITQQVRNGLMATFEAMGGEAALLEWAKENPATFFQMWSRAVPRESESVSRASGITVNINGAAQLRSSRTRPVIDVTPQ